MTIQEARKALDSTTFLLGPFQRSSALKALAASDDPAAAELLASAVDANSPSAAEAREVLAADRRPAWGDRLWLIWSKKRQPWLDDVLKKRGAPAKSPDSAAYVLSRLKLGGQHVPVAGVKPDLVAPFLKDAVESVADGALATLLALRPESVPVDRATALAVAAKRAAAARGVADGAKAYLERVFSTEADFVVALAFKCGLAQKVAASAAAVAESLRLLRDPDAEVSAAARGWLAALPRDQRYHDLIVDDWLRTDDVFLGQMLKDGQRLPSDPGREALLRLLWGDAKGCVTMDDPNGDSLAEALAAANEARRAAIVRTVQTSRDGALAERFRKASLKVQGMDAGLALKALQATGDEGRVVDATREMTGAELFEQCRRWAESGRRPTDPRRREAVERAVALLGNQPKIEIEPAPALPSGTEDLIAVWAADRRSEKELKAELQAEDPFVRAGALFALARRGLVDAATLDQKQKSEQWAERFAATLAGASGDVSKDHVQWMALCAGVDEGTHGARVGCGPDEFEASAERLAKLRKAKTPLAVRTANELEVLQLFRALFSRGELVVSADDSADVKGAAQDGGVAAW